MAVFRYPATSISTTGLATEAKQDTIISELQDIEADIEAGNVLLTSIDGKDFATETTLNSLNSKVTTVDTNNVTISAALPAGTNNIGDVDVVSSVLPTGAATEATLSTLDGKVTAVDTGNVTVVSSTLPTGAATAANQATGNASLSNIETDIGLLEDRLAGSLVPETHDYLELSYVAAGNGTGEIETVIYKTGGSGGTTVATLTLAYDGSDRLASVTRS